MCFAISLSTIIHVLKSKDGIRDVLINILYGRIEFSCLMVNKRSTNHGFAVLKVKWLSVFTQYPSDDFNVDENNVVCMFIEV